MSIKGKPKTIPPYYKTAGKYSFEFGEEVRNPHRYTAAPAFKQVALSFDQALERIDDRGLIMTPFSRFIPLPYLAFNTMSFQDSGPDSSMRSEFLNNLARRAFNNLIAQRGIIDPIKQQQVTKHIPWLVRKMRTKERTGPFVDVLQSVWTEGKLTGTRQMQAWMKNWCGFDWPIDLIGAYGGTRSGGVYSRDAMLEAFKATDRPATASQRTYEARIQHLTLVYRSVPIPPRKAHPFLPLVIPVVTADQMMYQKMYMMLHGTIDLQQVNFLVDREIDNPQFAIGGLREFYKKMVEPHLLSISANIWKVPMDFIQSHCFLAQGAPQAKNIFEYEEVCSSLIDSLYKTVSGTNRPIKPPGVVLVEKDPELEATILAAENLVVEEDAPRPLADSADLWQAVVDPPPSARRRRPAGNAAREETLSLIGQIIGHDLHGRPVYGGDPLPEPEPESGLLRMERRAQQRLQEDGNVLPRPATAAEDALDAPATPTRRRPGLSPNRRPNREHESAADRMARQNREREEMLNQLRQSASPWDGTLSNQEHEEIMDEAEDIILPDRSEDDWFRLAEGLAENPE